MKISLLFRFIVVFVTFMQCGSLLPAATLADYTFDGDGVAAISGSHFSATDATWGDFSSYYGFSATTNSAYVRADQLSLAFNAGQYLTLTLKADAGYTLNLESITLLLGGSTSATATSTGPQFSYAQIRTSADGFASSLILSPGSTIEAATTTPVGGTTAYLPFTADLTSLGLFDEITLRIYVYSSGTRYNTNYLRLDQVTLSGDIQPVPEPSVIALFVAALALGMGAHKRNRHGDGEREQNNAAKE